MKKFVVMVALFTAMPASAQVYKCKEGATTVFSSLPCAADARQIDVRPAASGGTAAAAPVGAAQAAPSMLRQVELMFQSTPVIADG